MHACNRGVLHAHIRLRPERFRSPPGVLLSNRQFVFALRLSDQRISDRSINSRKFARRHP